MGMHALVDSHMYVYVHECIYALCILISKVSVLVPRQTQ